MSRWLDIARKYQESSVFSPDTPTKGDKSSELHPGTPLCQVLSGCRVNNQNSMARPKDDDSRSGRCRQTVPDSDAFEERTTIVEFDAGLPRKQSKDLAAQAQSYANVIDFWAAAKCARDNGMKDHDF